MKDQLYHHQDIDFKSEDLERMSIPKKLLMVTPAYFDVVDVRNAYMEANIGGINKQQAWEEWDSLHSIYRQLESKGVLDEVVVMQGQPHLVDMVFAANQSLPWLLRDDTKVVILSHMRNANRQQEVAFFQPFYSKRNYQILPFPEEVLIEGNGDMIAHPGRRLIWAGYGHRSSFQAATRLPELLETPVIPLHLVSEHFYHLDTCFMPIDEKSVLLCENAFDKNSLDAIHKVFEQVIVVDEEEAISTFALNGLVLTSVEGVHHVIIQNTALKTIEKLESLGCVVHAVETGEFMKSGGSVFCMKMMLY